METSRKIILASSAAFAILILIAFFIGNFAISGNLAFVGLMVLMIPYSLYRFFEFKRIKGYEEKFPLFLRDIADSQRSGLSTIQAIQMSARSDYGDLSKEIKKINNQLSWNIPLTKVLESFGRRMRRSRTITRSLMIIDQANKSGGNIEDTMDSLATNIESIKEVQEEKRTLLSQQIILMYAIFFIFLGISLALIKFLIPMLQTQLETQVETDVMMPAMGLFSSNPCEKCFTEAERDISCASCDIFFIISASFGFGEREDAAAYYKALFFAMITIQGFFCGLIVGQIGSESIVAGIKHSIIMLMSGAFIFLFVLKAGLI